MIVYTQERLADIKDEIAALVPQQVAEMAVGFENFVEQPNWEAYLKIEAKGLGILFTARESPAFEWAPMPLVGYFGAYVYKSTTSQHTMVQATPYYVIPCRFRGIILKRLVTMLLEHPLAPRPRLLMVKTHVWADAGPILAHLGFRPVEIWHMLEQS